MKANELMVDDWVEVVSNDHLKYVQIAEIYQNSILTKESEFESEEVSIDNIKPIPLTSEILEKNGFVEINDDKKWYKMQLLEENDFVGLEKLEDCYWMFGAVFFPNLINQLFIKYVHELQHLLKLCRIEKEIKL